MSESINAELIADLRVTLGMGLALNREQSRAALFALEAADARIAELEAEVVAPKGFNATECSNCGDDVLTVSSRGYCDGCEEMPDAPHREPSGATGQLPLDCVVWSTRADGTRSYENTAALTRGEAERIVARYTARGIRAGIEGA